MAEAQFFPRDVKLITDIADFNFVDCYLEPVSNFKAETSDYPREDNTTFIDNFSIKPASFRMRAFVSGTFFRASGDISSVETSLNNPQSSVNKRRVFRAFIQAFTAGVVHSLVTPVATYSNLIIESIDNKISLAEGTSLQINVTFKQLLSGFEYTIRRGKKVSDYESSRNNIDFGIAEIEELIDVSKVKLEDLKSDTEALGEIVDNNPELTRWADELGIPRSLTYPVTKEQYQNEFLEYGQSQYDQTFSNSEAAELLKFITKQVDVITPVGDN